MCGSHQYDKKLGMGGCADKKYCFLLYQMEKIDTLSIANFIKDNSSAGFWLQGQCYDGCTLMNG